jgi:hypothetical protein
VRGGSERLVVVDDQDGQRHVQIVTQNLRIAYRGSP